MNCYFRKYNPNEALSIFGANTVDDPKVLRLIIPSERVYLLPDFNPKKVIIQKINPVGSVRNEGLNNFTKIYFGDESGKKASLIPGAENRNQFICNGSILPNSEEENDGMP